MGVFTYDSRGDASENPDTDKQFVSVYENGRSLKTTIPADLADEAGISEGKVCAQVTDEGIVFKPL
jgi:bifunctional DNA-binding transcriptional regulator/antitoxin component of YhaV-PrlF toxin-antitoxin module